MRALAVSTALILLLASVAGCIGQSEEPDNASGPDDPDTPGPGNGPDKDPNQPTDRGMQMPALSPGIAWTYNVDGLQAANDTLTLVTASANLSGYLFAGGNRSDLYAEITFDQPWLGPLTRELNPQPTDDTNETPVLFDFPIKDGKTWLDRGTTVTAEKTTLDTAFGQLQGYKMTANGPEANRTWTISRDTGYLASYTATDGGTTLISLDLANIETTTQATWYDTHGQLRREGIFQVTQLGVTADATHLVIGAHIHPGGEVSITPPLTSMMGPTIVASPDAETYSYNMLPGAEGDWTIQLGGNPDTPTRFSGTAVSWTPLTPSGP